MGWRRRHQGGHSKMRGKAWKGGKAFRTPIEYCDISGKVCFDKKGAQTAANSRMDEAHQPLRIYPCPCGSWHLTSTKVFREKI